MKLSLLALIVAILGSAIAAPVALQSRALGQSLLERDIKIFPRGGGEDPTTPASDGKASIFQMARKALCIGGSGRAENFPNLPMTTNQDSSSTTTGLTTKSRAASGSNGP